MAQQLTVLALLAAAAAGSPFPQLLPFANGTAGNSTAGQRPFCIPQFVTVPAATVTLPASTFTEQRYATTQTERSGPSVVTESASVTTVATTLFDTTTVYDTATLFFTTTLFDNTTVTSVVTAPASTITGTLPASNIRITEDASTVTRPVVRLGHVTETSTMTKETTVTMTSEETITQTLSHKVPPKIVTLPASSIYRTITKVQAPEPVTSISTVTATRSKMIYKTVTDYVTSTETLAPSRVTVNHIAAPTVKPVLANAPSNESLQALYEAVRVARSLTELYESLPEDLKQLARANPTVIDGLYGHFRWYEKSHAEIKGFAPKVAEEVDLTCSSNGTDTNAQGFSAIIAEPPKYDGCKAKIEKAKSEVSPAFRMEEDCSSIPDELRAGCPSVCGFYQATQG